jgi:hypothetical protein
MATKKEIDQHLKIALEEVGKIKPWFDKEVNAWVFAHRLYPVEYGGDSPEEVIENYPKYLREFIKHRLDDRLAPSVKKMTKGHGGKREGAGRPRGTRKSPPTTTIRLRTDYAKWIKEHEDDLNCLISGEKVIVPARKRSKRIRKNC